MFVFALLAPCFVFDSQKSPTFNVLKTENKQTNKKVLRRIAKELGCQVLCIVLCAAVVFDSVVCYEKVKKKKKKSVRTKAKTNKS